MTYSPIPILTLLASSWAMLVFQPAYGADDRAENQSLQSIISSDHRVEKSTRDVFRHPLETLSFFEVEPHHSVVEIWPGGGWYAEILAPYLKNTGTYTAAHFDPKASRTFFRNSRAQFEARIANEPAIFENAQITTFAPPEKTSITTVASADRILTFRNVHNWYMRGAGEDTLLTAFQAFYTALKPDGILGVVEHRLPEHRPHEDQQQSGYMKQSYVIAIAEKAGFELIKASEVNANPKDTADHPNGVWTLPPRLRIDDDKKAQFEKIGESDRMTLKFRKREVR